MIIRNIRNVIYRRMMLLRGIGCCICILLLFSCIQKVPSQHDDVVIGLQPLGHFDHNLLDSIKMGLETEYECHIVILNNIPLPQEAFVQMKSPRYRADSLLRYLLRIKPDTMDYIMGLTLKDISTTKKDKRGRVLAPESRYRDWGVFGLGFRPGNSCVISTFRIYHKDSRKFSDRLIKICVHELGHNLGLHHCPTPGCVMQDAVESIKTVDHGTRELCSQCRNIILH